MNTAEPIVAEITRRMDARNAARDQALVESRQAIRCAANAIRALHRDERDQTDALLEQGRDRLAIIAKTLAPFPDLYWAGYVQDAQKEIAEAHLLRALVDGDPLPTPENLSIEDAPWLNGLGEAASELRRYILDLLRRGPDTAPRAESLLETMDSVYALLVTVDYPDALTNGLRRTTDLVRGVLERTRGDLTLTIRQAALERALKEKM